MKKTSVNGSSTKYILFGACLVVILFVIFGFVYRQLTPMFYFASNQGLSDFPSLENVDEDVKPLLLLAQAEYSDPKPGSFYAEGANEPWCADFVSYLYKESEHSFVNPNTGSWRIPGIYTLREYFESINAWHPEAEYLPQPGDVVIYEGGLFGGHTNIVIQVTDDYIITVGGNEGDRIRLDSFNYRDKKYGLQGFGHIIN